MSWGCGIVVAAALLAAACGPSGGARPVLPRAPDYLPRQIRQVAILVRVGGWPDLSDQEREALADSYEGALVEAFDERGLPPTDLQRVAPGERLDARLALARAREVRADHAMLVELTVSRRDVVFCRDSGRPFRAITTIWSQGVQVWRVSDGSARVTADLDVTELEANCEIPRRSRLRDRAEMIASAVQVLTQRVLGP